EDLAAARRGLDGIADLVTRCPRRQHKTARSWRIGALKHVDLLERFGRYPYRNAALGRPSTPAGEAVLARPEFPAMFMRSQTPQQPGTASAEVKETAGAPAPAPRARTGGPRLRILALHGFRQNGEVFRARTRKMRLALEDIAELVFVTSPMAYTPT